jgi:pimeloyl-ACP methyl ester carboxylesterase
MRYGYTPDDWHGVLTILLMLVLTACGGTRYPVGAPAPGPATSSAAPNYSQLFYWGAHPAKHDAADSLPAPYRRDASVDSSVAVFFVHPTTYTEADSVTGRPYEQRYWNASVNDASLNAKTDYSTLLNQASAFNRYWVFAPRYRQAHIRSFFIPDSVARPFFDTAYADVKQAFLHFLKAIGQRPFIIAAHSQGTLHAARLLQELIDGQPLQQRLVAAYLIGLPVPNDYFKQCQPCATATSVGCFVSWRTYRRGYVPDFVRQEKFTAVVHNPISWRLGDTAWVPRQQQQGAVLYRFNKPKAQNVGAQVHGNILWSSKPRFFGNLFFTTPNYHIGDINLFWRDIRLNTMARVEAYFAQHR